jgi:hypothetical protein
MLLHQNTPQLLPGKSISSQHPNMTSPHYDAVALVKKRTSNHFNDIVTSLPKIRGNPRAPNHVGHLSVFFSGAETSKISTVSTMSNTNRDARSTISN